MDHVKTLKVRIKDKHVELLNKMARAVNFVWNYCNELSCKAISERHRFLSAYDMHPLMVGAHKELGLHSQTLQKVAQEYVTRRKQFKKMKLRWRSSFGSHRSLGWIPVNTGAAKWKDGAVYHNGQYFKVWDSFGLDKYQFRAGCFCEDSRGHWYFCVAVEVEDKKSDGTTSIGVDLGLKEVATTSEGQKLEAGRWYRKEEAKLATAQRAKKKQRVKAIHACIKNRRADALHKFSTQLVRIAAAIFVGNVSSSALVKTRMAKSVLDAGWSMLKTMLQYKSQQAGVWFEEVNESYSTQTCSACSARSGPKGIACLGIREWSCCECGINHNRDINAAKNILAAGHRRLAVGIPPL